MTDREIPIANATEYDRDKTLFHMWAGSCGDTECYVWADHFEDAFEEFVEWLDGHAPGHLVSFSVDDYKAAAKDLGVEYPADPDYSSEEWQAIAEHAESDHTCIGHTTLKHGTHIASDDWGGGELDDCEEYDAVVERCFDPELTEFQQHLKDIGACYIAREIVGTMDVEAAIGHFIAIDRTDDVEWLSSNSTDANIRMLCRTALDEHEAAEKAIKWAYGNGMSGCMYDHTSGPYDTAEQAASGAAESLELSAAEERELRELHLVRLKGDRCSEVGAALVELFEVAADWTCD